MLGACCLLFGFGGQGARAEQTITAFILVEEFVVLLDFGGLLRLVV